jgi:Holliday junction resolvase RusA-like endonuclease
MKDLTVTVNPAKRIARLDFFGPLSAIPSTTNGRLVVRGRSMKSPEALAKLTAMSWLFHQETRLIRPLVTYKEPVHVLLILGERYDKRGRKIHRWDSHNMVKAVGDWLQAMGVVQDDSHAEIEPKKRVDYFRLPSGERDIRPLTTIIIQPLRNRLLKSASLLDEIRRESLEFDQGAIQEANVITKQESLSA